MSWFDRHVEKIWMAMVVTVALAGTFYMGVQYGRGEATRTVREAEDLDKQLRAITVLRGTVQAYEEHLKSKLTYDTNSLPVLRGTNDPPSP